MKNQSTDSRDAAAYKKVSSEMKEFDATIKFQDDKIMLLKAKVNQNIANSNEMIEKYLNVEERVAKLVGKSKEYERSKQALSQKMKALKRLIDQKQMEELSENKSKLRITGMRALDPTDASENVKRLAAIIGVTYCESDIVYARFEYPVGPTELSPSIFVEFVSAELCEVWMDKYVDKAKVLPKKNSRVIYFNMLPVDNVAPRKRRDARVLERKF